VDNERVASCESTGAWKNNPFSAQQEFRKFMNRVYYQSHVCERESPNKKGSGLTRAQKTRTWLVEGPSRVNKNLTSGGTQRSPMKTILVKKKKGRETPSMLGRGTGGRGKRKKKMIGQKKERTHHKKDIMILKCGTSAQGSGGVGRAG